MPKQKNNKTKVYHIRLSESQYDFLTSVKGGADKIRAFIDLLKNIVKKD